MFKRYTPKNENDKKIWAREMAEAKTIPTKWRASRGNKAAFWGMLNEGEQKKLLLGSIVPVVVVLGAIGGFVMDRSAPPPVVAEEESTEPSEHEIRRIVSQNCLNAIKANAINPRSVQVIGWRSDPDKFAAPNYWISDIEMQNGFGATFRHTAECLTEPGTNGAIVAELEIY